jgi:hypothetical protein
MTPPKKTAVAKKGTNIAKRKAFMTKIRELTSWGPSANAIEEYLASEPMDPKVRKPRLKKRHKKPKQAAENEDPKPAKAPKPAAPAAAPADPETDDDVDIDPDDLLKMIEELDGTSPIQSPTKALAALTAAAPTAAVAAAIADPAGVYVPAIPVYHYMYTGPGGAYAPAAEPTYGGPAEPAYPAHHPVPAQIPPSPMDAEMVDA